MIIKSLLKLLMLSTFWQSAVAEETPLAQLKTFLRNSTTLSADFQQVSLDKAGNPAKSSTGKFYLHRPGKFRWNYEQPFIQQIVSNNGKVWFYDEDLEQVTIKKLDDSLGSTPALLLTGQVNLDEKFTLQEQGKEGDMNWIKLTPKDEESGFKYVLIGLHAGQLAGMELSDNFGQLTRIYFNHLQINPALNDALFNFSPPQGVDVFGN